MKFSDFAEVNGARLYHEVAGSGDPIVLIHGNFSDCRCWDDQFLQHYHADPSLRCSQRRHNAGPTAADDDQIRLHLN